MTNIEYAMMGHGYIARINRDGQFFGYLWKGDENHVIITASYDGLADVLNVRIHPNQLSQTINLLASLEKRPF